MAEDFWKLSGVATVALLALTACSGTPSDQEGADSESSPSATEPSEETTPDDSTQEPSESPSPTESSDSADGDSGIPELADIEDDIWEVALAQESVQIVVEQSAVPDGMYGTDEESQEQSQEDSSADDEPLIVMDYVGSLPGEGSQFEYMISPVGLEGQFLSFDSAQYQSREGFLSDYAAEAPEEAGAPSPDEIAELFDRDWIDHTGYPIEIPYTAEQYLETTRDNLVQVLGVPRLADLDAVGEASTLDGEDVWVYTGGDVELTVLADVEEPLLMYIEITLPGADSTVTFSDWNESEGPEEPNSEDVYTTDEIEELLTELFMDQ